MFIGGYWVKYKIKRDLTKEEFFWLPRDIKKGETVIKFCGPSYGCCSRLGDPFVFNKGEPCFELFFDWIEEVIG